MSALTANPPNIFEVPLRNLSFLLFAILVATPGWAFAKEDQPLARGIDPVSTKLSLGIDRFLAVEGARTTPAGSYQLELTLDFASGLIALQLGDEKEDNLIRNRLDIHLSGAWAITNWAEIALDLPFTAYQSHGFDKLQELTGLQQSAPASTGLGDIRVLGKVRLLEQEKFLFNLAALAEIRLPTGRDQSFLGERGTLFSPRLVADREFFQRLRLGFEAGYRLRTLPGRYNNLYVGDEFTLALASALRLPEMVWKRWWAYGELHALTQARAPFIASSDSLKTPLELLLGIRAEVYTNFWATLGGSTGLASQSGFGRNSFRLFASLRYQRVVQDRDGDGIPDDKDQCPDVPEDKDGFEDEDGCPDPDNDKDGIPDKDDQCPLVPGLKKFQGCPDSDKDGIPDHQDKCPKQPGLREFAGCPDSDGDKVPDPDDQCPQVPGPKEYDGCPDADGDEIPDKDDQCPDKKGPATNQGCPINKPAVSLEEGQLLLKDTIHFDTAQATIKKESYPILDQLVRILTDHPEIKKLRIEGHTDNVGSAPYNRDLSQRRAETLVQYLISKGIDKSRLTAQGFGFDRPIAPNITAMGRALNRRVEFSIAE